MRIIGDRSRARLLDRLIKDKKNRWASLVVVGVKDDLEAKSLLQWCRNLALTVVWRAAPGASRQEKQRQEFARDRMRKWAAIYKRFTLVEAATADAPELLDGQQFDAVALWGLTPAQLAAEGPAWAGLVRDGGALVGMDHRVVDCRRVLNAAVPEWSALRDGVWSVKVRRSSAPVVDESLDGALVEVGGVKRGEVETLSHDPVDSRSDADDVALRPSRDAELADDSESDATLGVEAEEPINPALDGGSVVGHAIGDGAEVAGPDGDYVTVADQIRLSQSVPVNGPSENGASIADESLPALTVGGSELHADTIAHPAPKRRGRPPGSKNRAPGVAAARGRKAATP